MGDIPIVTLDKIYISANEKEIFFLDCTRVNDSTSIISRKKEPLDSQIKRISQQLFKNQIILADDVVFTGAVLKNIINKFNNLGIEVVRVISSICTLDAYLYFNENLKYGIKTNYLLEENVIDQICERDFYFGIAGSGIILNTKNGLFKAPYFKPYGNPCERASIPKEFENSFSKNCLLRSIYLWDEMDKIANKKTLINELPETIINTKPEDEVVKTLRSEARKIWKDYK